MPTVRPAMRIGTPMSILKGNLAAAWKFHWYTGAK